ncbi:transcriptional regulator, ArsR family [Methanospirillum hungatei JF-1]|uniref:Transcriptional regulator, ArsR family n=1 Tax=Methanospirillum hungatei JF-1 (strain ATCC 27890 / DSM 864 / NBRC 100397 / JF-1) TaxID=323259 RepID=Q2FTY5_METHJ|nr:ArsR family transcriptional regulator [Methanospirillum hungatei]ABD41884.1 transcriptional regulator, ArsR family [Methanospirillum hungatei JF-1]MBP9007132.1 ArsR family transcriptional regulator [Methanospirillum sp.]HOW03618.1 ArsR family transcriptional regulator [Methanospirillum hungatei]
MEFERLPPSAKLVYKVLETGEPLTQKAIIEKTRLPPRTVRYAIRRLKMNAMLKERLSFMDARQSIYSISESDQAVVMG